MERKEKIRNAVRQNRVMKSEDEKGKTKENDKIRKATMRKNMTEEEKRIQREKDKRRKAENRKLKKELEKDKEGDDRSKQDEKVRREEIDDSKDEEKENNGESYVEKLRRINRKSEHGQVKRAIAAFRQMIHTRSKSLKLLMGEMGDRKRCKIPVISHFIQFSGD